MRKNLLVLSIVLVFYTLSYAQEQLVVTTYYPSPVGSYNQLQTNSLGVGDTNASGGLDPGDIPAANTNQVWIQGNVAIGQNADPPAIQLAIGDNDTGLQQQGDGELALFTNNGERVRINNVGNVGIGTNAPVIDLAIGAPNTGLQAPGAGILDFMTAGARSLRLDPANPGIGWGTQRGWLRTDQGASIELGGSGTPYIDFSNDLASNFDMQILLNDDDNMEIGGGCLNVTGWEPGWFSIRAARTIRSGMNVVAQDNLIAENGSLFVGNLTNPNSAFSIDAEKSIRARGNLIATNNLVLESGAGGSIFAANTEVIRVQPSGNIQVNNNVYADGFFGVSAGGGAQGFDFAETIPLTEEDKIESADVVVIDASNDIRLKKCDKEYDTRVAGVISTQPGMGLGQGSDNPAVSKPVSLVGRVPCKVTTINGPIQRGDLLVTSSKPGYAMKADPEKLSFGMVLGKALEPLEKGDGKITVLVNLM